MSDNTVKYTLSEREMPRQWYNIQADLPVPLAPPLHPVTGQPLTPPDLAPLFPMALIMQEVSTERWIDIPDEVLDVYRLWRPTTLFRARRLEKALDTPAKIFYKYEGMSPAGSHKPNTAVAQAYYNKKEGIKRIATETGAGQWGSALSFAGALFGIDIKVYMVKVSYDQKPYRRVMMEAWGAHCVPSPSPDTNIGRKMLAEDPDCPGSLGLAISEAVEDAMSREDTHYSLGSVLNHVLLHQTVNGLETKMLMERAGEYPDIIIGCAGGGSNAAGMYLPFVKDKIEGKQPNLRVINVEPYSCPTLTKGPFAYDYGDNAKMAPIVKMYTLGHGYMPPPIHAGGLRYHGMAPLVSQTIVEGLVTPRAIDQIECYEAAVLFARSEGIIPAPETSHAIAATIQEAKKAKEEGKEKVILFNLSGHGLMDLVGYDNFMQGKLSNYALPESEMGSAIRELNGLPKPKVVRTGKW